MKFSTFFLILFLFFAIFNVTMPIFVLAQGADCPENTICIDNPMEAESIEEVLGAITELLKTIAIPLGAAMIIWGGIQIMVGMTSGEKEAKVVKGKKTIMWALIGVAIVVSVDLLVDFIQEILS